jgi:hypothetical protein
MMYFIFVVPAECDIEFWNFVCVIFNLKYSVPLLNDITFTHSKNIIYHKHNILMQCDLKLI